MEGDEGGEAKQTPQPVRHAEKNRISTCKFADRIASTSITFYNEIKKLNNLNPSPFSVISTFIICKNDPSTNEKELQVVSFGEGTKFVHLYTKDKTTPSPFLSDCHAEILARKGFQKWLLLQLKMYFINAESSCLQRSGRTNKFTFKEGITLHFYTSSTPCGNSTLKKFYSGKQNRSNYSHLSEDEWPTDTLLPFSHFPAIHRGQTAVLVKRIPNSNENDSIEPVINIEMPPGTELPGNNRGNILTCSDKISLWNCLGVQGAILSHLFDPIKITTITIGRKFTKVICDRALILRLQSFTPKHIKQLSSIDPNYSIYYPALMCSSIKLTNEVIIANNHQANYFDSYSFVCYKNNENLCGEPINGKTGYLHSDSHSIDNSNIDLSQARESTVSTASLFAEFTNIIKNHKDHHDLEITDDYQYLKLAARDYQFAKNIIFTHKKLFGLSGHFPLCLQPNAM